MRYSYEYKLKCVELYRQGQYPETPEGVSRDRFRHNVRDWAKIEENCGTEALKHNTSNKIWSAEEKYELVAQVIAGDSCTNAALKAGISPGMLYRWVQKYKFEGYNGLVNKKKGRPGKEKTMKKQVTPTSLTESEREELIRLRAENEYLKTERSHKKANCLGTRKGCATQGEKAALINELREKGYQLKHLLKAMGMAKSTYYFELNKIDAVTDRNRELMNKIQEIFLKHKGRYGVRRIHKELVNQGYTVNHKSIQRLMHNMKLYGKRPKEKYHSYQGEVGKIAPNIIAQDFRTTAPLQKWTTDVSQFRFSWGKCYFSPILDMNTNEIITYDLSQSPNMEQIQRMLNKAFEKFPPVEGLILHSNQGWQYQHGYFRNVLKEHGIIQSMSRKGNCYDNCIMETFFGRLKNELFYGYEKEYTSFEVFEKAVAEYVEYYNNERIQAKTKWMPPVKYRIASMCA